MDVCVHEPLYSGRHALAARLAGGINELAPDRHKDEGGRENPDGKKRKNLDHGALSSSQKALESLSVEAFPMLNSAY